MKTVQYYFWSCLILFFLVSGTDASSLSVIYDMDHNNYGSNFCGLLVGVNDPETDTDVYRGDDAAYRLMLPLSSYGPMSRVKVQVGPGSDAFPATPWVSSKYIGEQILREANNHNPDTFLFYLTGHGGFWKETIGGVADPTSNHVKIGSNKILTDTELTQYLGQLPSEMNKIVIIDSCFSGGFIHELKSLSNISILTAASAVSKTAYQTNTGLPYFSYEIFNFITDKERSRESFSMGELKTHLEDSYWKENYEGMKAYEAGFGDEITLSKDWFDFQSYQSPSYTETAIPEPTTMLLFGFGLLSLTGVSRKKIA